MNPVAILPLESCPVCTVRIRPRDITVCSRAETFHADCWPTECARRLDPRERLAVVR